MASLQLQQDEFESQEGRKEEEAIRVAVGEKVQGGQPQSPASQQHRRSQSEVLTRDGKRSSSFQKLMQKAWQWGGNSREEGFVPSFNPEVLANQKRQWYQLHPKSTDHISYKEPTSLYENFVVTGLGPETNLQAVEEAFARRKKWELVETRSGAKDIKAVRNRAPAFPTMEPQLLFKYPPGKKLPMRMKDLGAFCFPTGVKPRLLERSPSLSELNELVYGQGHLGRDDLSFVFSLKVADNDTLYGVCLHTTEFVQRPLGILGSSSPLSSSRRCGRFLVSAPRCYCLLTRVPFFELHYEMLNSIIAQERLNRITQFLGEISFNSCVPSFGRQPSQMNGYQDQLDDSDWMASAIPVENAIALTAAAAGLGADDDSSSQRTSEPHSPESIAASAASETSDFSHQTRDSEKDGSKSLHSFDDGCSDSSEARSDAFDRIYGSYENGHASPDVGPYSCARSPEFERIPSFDSLFSPVRSMTIEEEDDDDEMFANHGKDFENDLIVEWAKENKNDLLLIICSYHAMAIPDRGGKIVFQPLDHLPAVEYNRPHVSSLAFSRSFVDAFNAVEVNAKLAAAEEAFSLAVWTTATICRVLSLESILTLIAGVLLEKQVIVMCPNLGVLSAVVLSLIPLIRPFQWQSLFLPVLPDKMYDFLDAPVPFIAGIQVKPGEVRIKTSNLVIVNVLSNQVKSCQLPTLPKYKELYSELRPVHAKLSQQNATGNKTPVYRCNEVQADAANHFLRVIKRYLESICADLRSHTITSVQSNHDRVCLLLKDSFIDSFPYKERPFIKLLVDTQLFSSLSDSRLTTFESGRF